MSSIGKVASTYRVQQGENFCNCLDDERNSGWEDEKTWTCLSVSGMEVLCLWLHVDIESEEISGVVLGLDGLQAFNIRPEKVSRGRPLQKDRSHLLEVGQDCFELFVPS